ncbi:MAG TPA: amino acid ABC transporter permease [Clostridia bacterium]|nr:amino acid ABC transporter permease [Clostridia bacterium]
MIYKLSEGMLESIKIFTLTLLFSLPLGLFVAFGRMSKNWILKNFTKLYISIMRGTPLILQLMMIYFGPFYIFGINLPRGYRFFAVIIGFVINYAAYFAEIYRGGIESIAIGQYEAAKVLGYSRAHTFIKIILPQVIKRILPSITNEVITLIKDTSLAFAISHSEMFTVAKAISAAQTTMTPFLVAGIFYYVFNFIVAFMMEWLEEKLGYYR